MRTDFCRRAKVELKRETWGNLFIYGRVVTEEDDSQYNPEDEEWLTYVEQDEYAKYPEY